MKLINVTPYVITDITRLNSVLSISSSSLNGNFKFTGYLDGSAWETHLRHCIIYCKLLLTFSKQYKEVSQYYHLKAKRPGLFRYLSSSNDDISIHVDYKTYSIIVYTSLTFKNMLGEVVSVSDTDYSNAASGLANYYTNLLQTVFQHYRQSIPTKVFEASLPGILQLAESQ